MPCTQMPKIVFGNPPNSSITSNKTHYITLYILKQEYPRFTYNKWGKICSNLQSTNQKLQDAIATIISCEWYNVANNNLKGSADEKCFSTAESKQYIPWLYCFQNDKWNKTVFYSIKWYDRNPLKYFLVSPRL